MEVHKNHLTAITLNFQFHCAFIFYGQWLSCHLYFLKKDFPPFVTLSNSGGPAKEGGD